MRPIRLAMSAFGPYSGAEIIDFSELQERNLFLITGATGAGKTTIFDAISYALYGKASGDLRSEDTLRSHFSEAELLTEVKLTFELKGVTYNVQRIPSQSRPKSRGEGVTEQKPDATLTIEDGEPRTVITGISKVNRKIEEIMGINVEQFKQIMMIPQGEFRQLLTADSQEREKVLQQLFDTYIYRRLQNDLTDQAKSLGNEIKSKRLERDTLVTKIKCGQDESLLNLIEAEEKFIEVIVQKTQSLMAMDQEKLRQLDQSLEKVDQEIKVTINQQNKAREDNKNIDQRKDLEEALKVQEALLPTMDEAQIRIYNGDRAARLIGIEDNIEAREKEVVRKKTMAREIASKTKVLTQALSVAEKAYEAVMSEESEARRNALKVELTRYKGYVEKVDEIGVLLGAIHGLEEKQKQNKKALDSSVGVMEALTKKGLSEQEEMGKLKHVAVALERGLSQREKAVKQLERLNKVVNQLEKMMVERDKVFAQKGLVEEALKVFEKDQKKYKEQRLAFLTHQAAILAKELKTGQACPVCGSLDHPILAVLPETVVTEDLLESLEDQMTQSETHYRKIKEAYVVKATNYTKGEETIRNFIGEVLGQEAKTILPLTAEEQCSTIKALIVQNDGDLKELQSQIKEQELAQKRFESLEKSAELIVKEREDLSLKIKVLEEVQSDLVPLLTEKKTNLAYIYKEVPEALREKSALEGLIQKSQEKVQEALEQMTLIRSTYDQTKSQHIASLTQEEGLLRDIDEAKAKIEGLQKTFDTQLKEAGFAEYELYNKAKLSEEDSQKLKKEQEAYRRQLDILKVTLKELQNKTKTCEKIDLNIFEEKLEAYQIQRKGMTEEEGIIKAQMTDNAQTISSVVKINDQIKDQERRYTVIGRLARVAQGNNPSMMSFERYVLAAFLEDILKAANSRLRQMTQGRYILSRTSELQRKNKQSGLELEVFDNFTGKSRHVKTLSGGEGFKASLSMALGLSDVVQSYAGGVRLDTMFIDEGFGTLDQESLDSAINCLIDLQKSGRLVGIISHVQELRERIDTRLEINSTNHGSQTRFVLG